jgi:hypothetical protein
MAHVCELNDHPLHASIISECLWVDQFVIVLLANLYRCMMKVASHSNEAVDSGIQVIEQLRHPHACSSARRCGCRHIAGDTYKQGGLTAIGEIHSKSC